MNRVGYWQSAWPVDCGANHRPKTVPTPGLGLGFTDRLIATTRNTGRWPVMFVQRDPGELYLYGTTVGSEPTVAGWVERVDPKTLQPTATSGDLPAGGHEWYGSIAVHANGDLYTANGSYLHRLTPDCSVVAELAIPTDHAHNGLLILSDGSIVTKDIRLGETPSTLTICDADLRVRASVVLPEPSMGRLAAVAARSELGSQATTRGPGSGAIDHICVPGSTKIFRYQWDGATLVEDPSWRPVYRSADSGGMAWDTTVVDGRVWLMDNGSIESIQHRFSQIPPIRSADGVGSIQTPAPWPDPVRAAGISVENPDDVVRLTPTELPSGWVIAPPLVHDGVAVVWDTGNTGIAAFDVRNGPGTAEMLWYQPFRTSMQPLLYPDTGELVINDFRLLDDNQTSDDLVVLDLRTGQMKARVATGGTRMNGLFLCPGWERDLYYCTAGTVARIRAESL